MADAPETDPRTIQLRRYELTPELVDDFIAWWTARLAPCRREAGFRIEFAYLNPEISEFTWAVSTPGDETRFLEIEAEYMQSPARAEVFDGTPKRIDKHHIRFVDWIA